jgi:hypothetical protein
MKRFKLAAVAAATLLAAGFANAGVLQVVPTSYAAETIPAAGANSPGFSYSLNAPINYLSSVKFTMEFKLDTALWAAAPPAGSFTMTDPNTGNFVTSSAVALNATGDTVIATFDSTATTGTGGLNSGVAWAVNGLNGKLFPANSVISITTTPQIKLSTTTVFNECAPTAVTIKIAATMKDALGNQTNETNGNLGSLANQSGPYVSINQGVITTMDSVAGELSKIDVLTSGVAGSAFSAPGGADATAGTTRIQIGRLTFANNGPFALHCGNHLRCRGHCGCARW